MGLLFESVWYDLGFLLVSWLAYKVFRIKSGYRYFQRKGIPYHDPVFLVGSNYELLLLRKTFGQWNQALYDQFPDERYFGFFQGTKPAFFLKDPELVQRLLTKDFASFQDHGIDIDEKTNPLDGNLFTLSGDKWRTLRHKLTPTFTSGKLKWMFGVMENTADNLASMMESTIRESGNDLLIKDIYARFSTDVIASCAFGIEADAIKDGDCEFRKMAKLIFTPSIAQNVKNTLRFLWPKPFELLKIRTQPKVMNDFFISITKQGLEHRKRTGEKRTDFLQLLLQLREKGSVDYDTRELEEEEVEELRANKMNESKVTSNEKLELTDELLAAQVFVFFLGGFENSASVMSFVSYFLAKNKDIQDRLRQEVRSAERLDYASVKEMKLLDACVTESLRLYSPAEGLLRKCNKDYPLGDGQVIEAGTSVMIPVNCLHRDPKYWDRPDEFYPDRYLSGFTPLPGTYLPFGDGPRICIAQRFALMQIKLAMAKLVDKFEFSPSSKLQEPIKLRAAFFQEVEGGMWISIKPAVSSSATPNGLSK